MVRGGVIVTISILFMLAFASAAFASGEASFSITKAVSSPSPVDGQLITYTIIVKNIGGKPGDVRVIDSMGTQFGQIRGDLGGYVRYFGDERALGNHNNQFFDVKGQGSIASGSGREFWDIPAGGTVTLSYKAKVVSYDLDAGVESSIENIATLSNGASSAAIVTLRGKSVTHDPKDDAPYLLPVPTQVLRCGDTFPDIDLDDYVFDDSVKNSYRISVSGNKHLQVSLDPATNVLTVSDPLEVGQLVESMRVTVTDDLGRRADSYIQFKTVDSLRTIPILAGIADQIVEFDDSFNTFRLSNHVQVQNDDDFEYYAIGSELLDVTIGDDSTVRITYEEELFEHGQIAQISEVITFGVLGCQQAEDTAVFTVVNDDPYIDHVPLPPDFFPGDPFHPPPRSSCAIKIGPSLVDDTDCDGVPDIEDNCPFTENIDQRDADRNRVGDACDLHVVQCRVRAGQRSGGNTITIEADIVNNLPEDLSNVRLNVEIPELGISEGHTVRDVSRGSYEVADVRLRIPACAQPGKYTLLCSARAGSIISENGAPISIQESSTCTPDDGSSSVEFFQIQDLIAGSQHGASFPVTIQNNQDVQKSYLLEADGILPWGDYVFESGSVVVVPPGQTIHTNMRVFATQGTFPGEYPFRVSISSGKDVQEVYLVANVVPVENVPSQQEVITGPQVIWIAVVIIILGLLILTPIFRGKQVAKKAK